MSSIVNKLLPKVSNSLIHDIFHPNINSFHFFTSEFSLWYLIYRNILLFTKWLKISTSIVLHLNSNINNISVISWLYVLLVEETGENHRPVASHWQPLSHNVVLSTPRHERESNSQLLWWYSLIARVVVNPIIIRPLRPHHCLCKSTGSQDYDFILNFWNCYDNGICYFSFHPTMTIRQMVNPATIRPRRSPTL